MDTADNKQRSSSFRTLVSLSVAVVIVAAAYTGYHLLNELKQESPARTRTITVATADQPVGAAIYVALAKGYFKDEGLVVTPQHHTSGRDALGSVIEGKADLCEVAETPIVFAGLRGIPIYTLATISSTEKNMAVVARRDKSIAAPADLARRKIGVTTGTNGDFFLSVFLVMHEILNSSVEVVNLRPEDMLPTLLAGEVDAVSTWNPHLTRLQKKLGDNGITFPNQGFYTWAWNLAATKKFVAENPGDVNRFLRAIVRAEVFIGEHPEESRSIVASFIGMAPIILTELWGDYNFRASLDQSLLTSMEGQARWAIKNDLVETDIMPNYLDYIYLNGLDSVDPSAITIIR